MKALRIVIAAVAGLATLGPVMAQETYPNKPIKVIVPFAAGNAGDILARVFGEHVGKQLNTTLVVENRPGADSVLGASLAATAKNDGYTIMLASNGALAAAPALNAKLSYDPERDFAPITQVTQQGYVIVVKSDSALKSVPDLIAAAKSQPGKVTFASSNITTRFASELLKAMAGIEMTNVPYAGTEQAFQDVKNGQVSMMFAGELTALPHIQRGDFRALAVSTQSRSPVLPEVPPLADFLPGYSFIGWHALVAPSGTSPQIIDKLNTAFRQAMADPAAVSKLAGITLKPSTPDQLRSLIAGDVQIWKKLAKDAGVTPAN